MRILFIVSDPPCGAERIYNALQLALAVAEALAADKVLVF